MEYLPEKKEILLNRELSELDKFVIKFINIFKRHARYVIMSGYVSIILGRSRSTEDVDLFLEKISESKFKELFNDLDGENFWCLNTSNVEEMYDYLKRGFAIRFAEKEKAIPNFEIKFPKDEVDEETFSDSVVVKTSKGDLLISSPERHIAFKRYYLASDKDEEDALHVEEIFKGKIDYDKIEKLRKRIKNEKQR